MIPRFKQNIEKQNLFSVTDKILATVSGGVDSVVLCYLLKKLNFRFEIAHFNFKLRGTESDQDEEFVKELANQLDVRFHTNSFDTGNYAKKNGVSTQMAARELRFKWFEELKKESQLDYILTAHHKNDNVETVLLNLVRGTGHKGLVGIESKRNDLIRPLLPFTKEEIVGYAKKNKINWREDVSNESNKYKRNLIRNKVIPLFEELNPNFVNTFSENISKFSEETLVLNSQLEQVSSPVLIEEIGNHLSPLLSIWNWIEQYGFTYSDAKDIVASMSGESGKKFISNTHQLIKDRDTLILQELDNKTNFEEIELNEVGEYKISDYKLKISLVKEVDFSLGERVAYFNASKLKFPLTIRKWEDGDKFQPLGMKGMKKVSDYLIDTKVSLNEKEKQLVVVSDNQIIWLAGKRVDERFKVLQGLVSNYKMELISNS